VIAAYRTAITADTADLGGVEALIAFARAVGRPDDAEWGFRERVQRQKESPEPHIAFGDFLVQDRKDPMRAIEQYNLALVWQPDSLDAKNRIADIYLGQAEEHFEKKEYASAEARLAYAQKFVTDPQSYQAARIREIRGKLRACATSRAARTRRPGCAASRTGQPAYLSVRVRILSRPSRSTTARSDVSLRRRVHNPISVAMPSITVPLISRITSPCRSPASVSRVPSGMRCRVSPVMRPSS